MQKKKTRTVALPCLAVIPTLMTLLIVMTMVLIAPSSQSGARAQTSCPVLSTPSFVPPSPTATQEDTPDGSSGNMDNGTNISTEVTASPPASATVVPPTATMTAAPPTATVTDPQTVVPVFLIRQDHTQTGQTIVFHLLVSVTSAGTVVAPDVIVVHDILPAGFTDVTATGTDWTMQLSATTSPAVLQATYTGTAALNAGTLLPPMTLQAMVSTPTLSGINVAMVNARPAPNLTVEPFQTHVCSTATVVPAGSATPTITASPVGSPTASPGSSPTAVASPGASPIATVPGAATAPSVPGSPILTTLESVTDQAYAGDEYVPNGWGMHKNRLVRTSTGDIFTVYVSQGSDQKDRQWHLLHRRPQAGAWEDVQQGNAGEEPINILRGPDDAIHLFTWPATAGALHHLVSTDLGKTFTEETIPGQWTADQGYSGSGINAQGDMVIAQSGNETPGTFLWAYYAHASHTWQFHTTRIDDYRYTYAFFLPGQQHDLTIAAMRDVQRPTLGYPPAPAGQMNYVFDAIKYMHIADVDHPDQTLTQQMVAQETPQTTTDYDLTYLTDTYSDTQGRTHILYGDLNDGTVHHVVVGLDGQVTNTSLHLDGAQIRKTRITQDALGHFYLIAMDTSGNTLNLYPGTATDTDGTSLAPAIKIDISHNPGCSDDDRCHSPTITVPRNGSPVSNAIDGVYGNFGQEVFFHLQLRP